MKIKYIPVFTDDVEKQISFFTEKLGLQFSGKKKIFQGLECDIFRLYNTDIFLIIVKHTADKDYPGGFILNSDDCLNDYYTLKTSGVSFCNGPQYLPMGLGAEFFDPSGNRYLLIEERNYNKP